MADKSFTTADVSTHKDDANGYWLIVEDGVYDVSSAFPPLTLSSHPRENEYSRRMNK